MRFFLVGRDRSTGAVRTISDTTYESRDEALAVLGDETASAEFADFDLFVVDLDTVSPVVLYRTTVTAPPPAEPTVEPMADAWETPSGEDTGVTAADEPEPEEAEAVEEAVEETLPEETPEETPAPAEEPLEAEEVALSEETVEEPAPVEPELAAIEEALVVEEAQEPLAAYEPEAAAEPMSAEPAAESWAEEPEEDLASALRRAASTMEESGVVAPPSVEEFAEAGMAAAVVPESAEPPSAEPEAAPTSPEMWPWEAQGGIGAPQEESAPPEPESAPESEPEPEPAPQPTDSLLAAIASLAPAEEPVAAEAEPAPADEGAPEEAAIPAAEPASESAWDQVPESAIVEPLIDEEPQPVPQEPAGGEAAAPFVPVGIEEPGMEDISLLTPAEPGSVEPPGGAVSPDWAPAGATPDEAKAYEPGESDIHGLTCDDCVYVDTCTKHHEDGPPTCGAFQWKPV